MVWILQSSDNTTPYVRRNIATHVKLSREGRRRVAIAWITGITQGAISEILKPDSAKLVSPRSSTDEKVGGPVKNMGGPIKLLYITMFKMGKSCKKLIFGPVKHEKFSRCL